MLGVPNKVSIRNQYTLTKCTRKSFGFYLSTHDVGNGHCCCVLFRIHKFLITVCLVLN